jgi:hypothetical protein
VNNLLLTALTATEMKDVTEDLWTKPSNTSPPQVSQLKPATLIPLKMEPVNLSPQSSRTPDSLMSPLTPTQLWPPPSPYNPSLSPLKPIPLLSNCTPEES